jgi:hypothetical protein
MSLLDHPDKNVVDGGFYALDLICEDHPYELGTAYLFWYRLSFFRF